MFHNVFFCLYLLSRQFLWHIHQLLPIGSHASLWYNLTNITHYSLLFAFIFHLFTYIYSSVFQDLGWFSAVPASRDSAVPAFRVAPERQPHLSSTTAHWNNFGGSLTVKSFYNTVFCTLEKTVMELLSKLCYSLPINIPLFQNADSWSLMNNKIGSILTLFGSCRHTWRQPY